MANTPDFIDEMQDHYQKEVDIWKCRYADLSVELREVQAELASWREVYSDLSALHDQDAEEAKRMNQLYRERIKQLQARLEESK